MYKSAIIGGTGFEQLPPEYTVTPLQVETRYGRALLQEVGSIGGGFYFLSRHGETHATAPHEINHRANILALQALGVVRILASNAVGSLRLDLPPDSLVLVDDFIDMTRAHPLTLADSGVTHTDFSEPYCPDLRQTVLHAAAEANVEILPRSTYLCTDGPRFESPAEVRMYAQLGGDVVGMTGIPEAVFAREAGICYASVGIVTNYAAGLTSEPVSHVDIASRMVSNIERVRRVFFRTAGSIGTFRRCACSGDAVED